jgi:peptide/nickel transport system ATP-binding protein
VCDEVPPPLRHPAPGHDILCHIETAELSRVPPLWTRSPS